ncbi:MAG TPA: TetR family transcriptional regulator [Solirubrobacterales bacterium]|nr:TetR family transcriptional regulator [Solirubrobacterales bacterium]
MSSTDDKASSGAATARRPHDAEASRAALLAAAREVFDEVGYERATTREIGERAGVDPALIARYFDCKEGLFLAAIAAGPLGDGWELDLAPRALLGSLLERWDERGHSPVSRALASPRLTDDVRESVRGVVEEHLTRPLAGEQRGRGVADPELRAELLVALAVGVAMTRANGTLEAVAAAPRERLIELLGPLVEALVPG